MLGFLSMYRSAFFPTLSNWQDLTRFSLNPAALECAACREINPANAFFLKTLLSAIDALILIFCPCWFSAICLPLIIMNNKRIRQQEET
jgi:hypothetical protein